MEEKENNIQKQEPKPENKMGVMPVNRLLVSMSAPVMLSMLVQALYNIVDSVYVSRISENALNAVGLAFPVQNLMIAVATGTGVGINALLSNSLGQKNFRRANLTASNGVFLAVCSYTVFAVLGLRSIVRHKKPNYRHGTARKVYDNLLQQDFTAENPNQKWYTDFTQLFLICS